MSLITFPLGKSLPLQRKLRLPQSRPSECVMNALICANSLLVMKPLHQKVGSVGSFMARKVIHWTSPRVISSVNSLFATRKLYFNEECSLADFDDHNPFEGLRQLRLFERTEYTPVDTLVVTAGLASQILVYGAFSLAIGALPIPLENWNFLLLALGPWWSSSFWTDGVCYNFFMSSVMNPSEKMPGDEKRKPNALDRFVKYFPYEYHPELDYAYKYDKKSFYFCAMIIVSLYLYVFFTRPPVTDVLISKVQEAYHSDLSQSVIKCVTDSMIRSAEAIPDSMFCDL